jgi:hypothetical protein
MDILKGLGVEVNRLAPSVYKFRAANIDLEYLNSDPNTGQKVQKSRIGYDYRPIACAIW